MSKTTLQILKDARDDVGSREFARTLKFLQSTADYFEKRDTHGEDSAHWANFFNAENCRKACARFSRLSTAVDDAIAELSSEERRAAE